MIYVVFCDPSTDKAWRSQQAILLAAEENVRSRDVPFITIEQYSLKPVIQNEIGSHTLVTGAATHLDDFLRFESYG
jgi:hypothetical protein